MSSFRLACMLEGVFRRSVDDLGRQFEPTTGHLVFHTLVMADRLWSGAANW